MDIAVGSAFDSWDSLKAALDSYAAKQCVPYHVFCSQLIKSYNETNETNLPEKLKYYSLTYACKHYGRRREKSEGIRPNQSSFKRECPARVRIRVSEETRKLVVTKVSIDHNHDINPEDEAFYPENRRLTDEEKKDALGLLNFEVKPALLQNAIHLATEKCTNVHDIRNLKQKYLKPPGKGNSKSQDEDVRLLFEELEDMIKNDPGGIIEVGSKDGEVIFILWSSSEMKVDYEQFPEVLSLDNTYNTNNCRMPLAVFMCQDKNGHGRVAAYCVIRNETKFVVKEAFQCFAECHPVAIKKTKTVCVDKDMNEISRIWEVAPYVDIHLCRFHVTEIFKREIPAGPSKEEIRKCIKEMLYSETEEDYDRAYGKVKELSSEDFLKYFDKNWHHSKVIWKGFERLDSVTLGVTTTNNNESLHAKLKSLLNRRISLRDLFAKLRLLHSNAVGRNRYLEFINRTKVAYVANSKDPVVKAIVELCTPFVAFLVRGQYELSLKMDVLPGCYSPDESCSCPFYKSRGFPCAHLFFSRRLRNQDMFSSADVNERWWRLQGVPEEVENDQAQDPDDPGGNEAVEPVYVPSNPLKSGGRVMSDAEKYSKLMKLFARGANVAKLYGGKEFLDKCGVIETLIDCWEKNIAVVVVPAEKVDVVVLDERSSSTAEVQSSPADVPSSGSTEESFKCRCGLEAVSFVPRFGRNKGRKCLKCPKTLGEYPCTFLTVMNEKTTSSQCVDLEGETQSVGSVDAEGDPPGSNESVRGGTSDEPGGVKRHRITANPQERPNLNLPAPLAVKGQPRSSKQRVFKKTTKAPDVDRNVSDQQARVQKGEEIPDSDVQRRSAKEWTVQSQSKDCNQVYKVLKVCEFSSRCLCADRSKCVHCFACDCPDYIRRQMPCKHTLKIEGMYEQDDIKPILPAVNDGEIITITISSDEDEDEKTPPEISKPADEMSSWNEVASDDEVLAALAELSDDQILQNLSNLDQDTFDQEIEKGSPCSPNICLPDKIYNCFGCKAPLDRRTVQRNSKNFGREYYTCSNKTTPGCARMFWAPVTARKTPVKAPKSTPLKVPTLTPATNMNSSIRSYLTNQGNTEKDNASVSVENSPKLSLTKRNCPICEFGNLPEPDGAHKCAMCGTPVHSFGCSTRNTAGKEGFGGSDRLCWPCHDKARDLSAMMKTPPGPASCRPNAGDTGNMAMSNCLTPKSSLLPWTHVLEYPAVVGSGQNCNGVNVYKFDFESLLERGYLTDTIIDVFTGLMIDSARDHWAEIFRLPSHAFEDITYGLDSFLNSIAKSPIIFNDLWITPTHIERNHWLLFLTLIKEKKVVVLNPLVSGRKLSKCIVEHLQILRHFLQLSHEHCQVPLDWTQWRIHVPSDFKRQNNSFDCGVFVCAWIYSICSETTLTDEDLNEQQLCNLRKWISQRIFEKSTLIPTKSSYPPKSNVEHIDKLYEEADKNIQEGHHVIQKPWQDLAAPVLDFSPPHCGKSTLQSIGEILANCYKATDNRCGAPDGCRLRGRNVMSLCELCREWFHLRCIGDQRPLPGKEKPYICPLHLTGNTKTRRDVMRPIRLRQSLN